MAKNHETWNVLEHGPIEKLESNLWRVEGSVPRMSLRRVMTIIKHENGSLTVHNPISMDEDSMSEIEAWGSPSTLIVPNAYHRMDCKPFAARYPNAKLVCPAAARKKVSAVSPVDYSYEKFATDDSVSLRHIEGTAQREGVLIISHDVGATLVFNDLVFNMPHYAGFSGFVMRRLTASTGGPRISRLSKMMVVKNKGEVARDLIALSETPSLSRIIVSHHETQ